jgi:hypothetical protein
VGVRAHAQVHRGSYVGEENFRLGQLFFASLEHEAEDIAEQLRVRYVVSDGRPQGPRGAATMLHRLADDRGPGLRRHRLVFETPRPRRRGPHSVPAYVRVYEFVQGARLEGRAPPGETVTAWLRYVTNVGRRGVVRYQTVADPGGFFRLRLPYATEGAPPAVSVEPTYVLEVAGRETRVAIREEDVQAGLLVSGPDLGL